MYASVPSGFVCIIKKTISATFQGQSLGCFCELARPESSWTSGSWCFIAAQEPPCPWLWMSMCLCMPAAVAGLQKRATSRLLSPRHHWCCWEIVFHLGLPWNIASQSVSGLALSSFPCIFFPRIYSFLSCLLGPLTISTLLHFQAFRTLQQQVYQSSGILARLLKPVSQGSVQVNESLLFQSSMPACLAKNPQNTIPGVVPGFYQ